MFGEIRSNADAGVAVSPDWWDHCRALDFLRIAFLRDGFDSPQLVPVARPSDVAKIGQTTEKNVLLAAYYRKSLP